MPINAAYQKQRFVDHLRIILAGRYRIREETV
jgi:hypothetical protein